jgi:hypothetical protein
LRHQQPRASCTGAVFSTSSRPPALNSAPWLSSVVHGVNAMKVG